MSNMDKSKEELINELAELRTNCLHLKKELSQYKKAEKKILESEEQIRTIFNSIPIPLGLTRISDGKILFANPSVADLVGYNLNEVMGKSILDYYYDPSNRQELLEKVKKDGSVGNHEILVRKRDGSPIWLIISLRPIKYYKEDVFILAAYDITERKRAEEIIKESESQYRRIFDSMGDVIFVVDRKLNIVLVNSIFKEWKKELGFSSDGLGQNLFTAFPFLTSKMRTEYEHVVKTGEVIITEEEHELTGKKIITKTRRIPILESGQISRIITVVRNITDRKEAEAELQKAHDELEIRVSERTAELKTSNIKLQSEIKERKKTEQELKKQTKKLQESEKNLRDLNTRKDKLFSIISHDLRNPFNSLLGFSEILYNKAESLTTEKLKQYSERLNNSSRFLFNLIEKLLLWSHIQMDKLEFRPSKVNLFEITQESIRSFISLAAAKNITMSLEIDKDSFIQTDLKMLDIVIKNLLSNAIKYSHEGGEVKISAKEKNSNLELTVSDNGIGIRKEMISELFKIDTHYTTYGLEEEKGTGLGLVICKELLEKNGGKIKAESKENKETSFKVILPKEL